MPVSINLDTTSLTTAKPVIVDGHLCHVRLANCSEFTGEKGIQSSAGIISGLALEYHMLQPAPTVNGDQVKPGFPIFERIYYYGSDTPPGEVPKMAQTKICKRIDAFLGTGDPDAPGQPAGTINKKGKPVRPGFDDNTISQMIGKEAFVKVKAKTGDHEGNDVVSIVNPADLKQP